MFHMFNFRNNNKSEITHFVYETIKYNKLNQLKFPWVALSYLVKSLITRRALHY